MTDKLLVDDSLEAADPVGPLADLKRQMRMLSQGSPVLAPSVEQAAAMAAAAAEAQAEEQLVAAHEAAAAAAAAEAEAAPPAKTPRAALSLGYADSHNPATMRLLRSGGTTRLLAETGSLGGDEEDAEDEALVGGAAARSMGVGDGGATARTGGTTKLLADMTMASSIGAKLLGRGAQGELLRCQWLGGLCSEVWAGTEHGALQATARDIILLGRHGAQLPPPHPVTCLHPALQAPLSCHMRLVATASLASLLTWRNLSVRRSCPGASRRQQRRLRR